LWNVWHFSQPWVEDLPLSVVWACYTPHPTDNFHLFVPCVEPGFKWWKCPGEKLKVKSTWDGDHLITPFQCHFCQFQILTNQNLLPNSPGNVFLLCCIICANLDTLWGRETSTVLSNWRSLDQLVQLWKQLGVGPDVLPPLGQHPPQDLF
jgi:hypothetical protein